MFFEMMLIDYPHSKNTHKGENTVWRLPLGCHIVLLSRDVHV